METEPYEVLYSGEKRPVLELHLVIKGGILVPIGTVFSALTRIRPVNRDLILPDPDSGTILVQTNLSNVPPGEILFNTPNARGPHATAATLVRHVGTRWNFLFETS